MHSSATPLEIGHVALVVNDLARVSAFYRDVIGLAPLGGDGETERLGAGGRLLVELRADPAARRASPQEAGLFHTAFLLPDRDSLGRWLRHAAAARVPLQGASDHLVSEALYLADPEGNGIEIYRDRPRGEWPYRDGTIRMATERLDLPALAAAARGPWAGMPEHGVVGHVHLQAGDLDKAAAFLDGALGFAQTARYPGATFHGSGGYHHHLAANIWNSRGATERRFPATGLAEVAVLAGADLLSARGGPVRLNDPWGTTFVLSAKP